jgi:hypothetical protein
MGKIGEVKDIVGAVLYPAQAGQVTGEILHVDAAPTLDVGNRSIHAPLGELGV